ncbi:hypothetical protein ACFFQF_03550 [Haladaptatus pallidirubidus]
MTRTNAVSKGIGWEACGERNFFEISIANGQAVSAVRRLFAV